MNRREFISLGAGATMARCIADTVPAVDLTGLAADDFRKAVATLESTAMTDVAGRAAALDTVQTFVYAMKTGKAYDEFVCAGCSLAESAVKQVHAKQPVLWWYDRAFDRVLEALKSTDVKGDVPAVWYVYNMGIVVKTKTCAFAVDLCHRKATEMVPYLDFALVTHNHNDHVRSDFLAAIKSADKPCITNFNLRRGCYVAEDKELEIKDVRISVTRGDHNVYLPHAVNCYEISCGGEKPYVIYHSGDAYRRDQFKPKNPVDLFIGHCAIGLDFMAAFETTMPAKLMVTAHHQELGHLGGQYRCVGFHEEPAKCRRQFEKNNLGKRIAMPVWGDRIV